MFYIDGSDAVKQPPIPPKDSFVVFGETYKLIVDETDRKPFLDRVYPNDIPAIEVRFVLM
jgi:hypothetical protein